MPLMPNTDNWYKPVMVVLKLSWHIPQVASPIKFFMSLTKESKKWASNQARSIYNMQNRRRPNNFIEIYASLDAYRNHTDMVISLKSNQKVLTCGIQHCCHDCRKGSWRQYQAYPFVSLEQALPLPSFFP